MPGDRRKRTRKVASIGHRRREGTQKGHTSKNIKKQKYKQKQKKQTKDNHIIRLGQEEHSDPFNEWGGGGDVTNVSPFWKGTARK